MAIRRPVALLWLVWSVAVPLLAFGAWLILSERWWVPRDGVRTGPLTMRSKGTGGVLVKAWVATNRVEPGQSIPFWLVFENQNLTPIGGLHLLKPSWVGAGFDIDDPCWVGTTQAGKDAEDIRVSLDANASVIVAGRLRALAETGMFQPVAVLEWTDARGQEHWDAIGLGPLQVVRNVEERAILAGRRALTILKDVAIPLIILIGGFLFQRWSQAHAERESFLPQVLKENERYYLPACSRLVKLRRHLKTLAKATRLERDESLYSLLRFLAHMTRLSERAGGVQLKNRDGELVITTSYHEILLAVERHFGVRELSFALRAMAIHEPLVTFLERFEPSADPAIQKAFNDLRLRFDTWINDPTDGLPSYAGVIDVFFKSLVFEVNAPFLSWYGKPEPFPAKELAALQPDVKRFPAVARALTTYLKRRL